ncbi:B3 domain-containing protein At4g05630-like [Capsella rubella]|uniref:B3 domain-containing protein At4g05630-like n=1 Tax=Capsella rubella TaxID=81985 RepID=UPI000CD52F4B|nr:B3 domain-containing protein At4g05630-like [Capsella rubella]
MADDAGTNETDPIKQFDANNPWNILLTLRPSDVGTSNTLTVPRVSAETRMLPFLSMYRFRGYVDFYDVESDVVTTLTLKRQRNGDYHFHGWSMVLERKHCKTGDTVVFWWDNLHRRFNFELVLIA